jgi:hypothetical protein
MAEMDEKLLEVSIRVFNPVCILSRELGSLIKIEDIRSYGDKVAHLIELPSNKFVEARMIASKTGDSIQGVESKGDYMTGWFMSKGCDACKPLALGEAFLVKGRLMEDGSMEFNFIVPGESSYSRILEELNSSGIEYDIVRVASFRSERVLTANQEKVLYIAMRMGIYDHPRRITLNRLAEMLGVSPSTLTEVLRRGLRRLLKYYFG